MNNRILTLLSLIVTMLFGIACAAPNNAADNAPDKIGTQSCKGQSIEGPWFSFLLPEGMQVDGVANGKVKESSVWLKTQVAGEPISFFLYSPRHGGKPYQIFLGSTNVSKQVEIDSGNREIESYVITYDDGSTGQFEGNAQKITGFRVGDAPLGPEELEKYNCFLQSIEQYAE